jgi:hypothetical protein
MKTESYRNRGNRDDRARELKKLGYKVRRYSMPNQTLDPSYVKDSEVSGGDYKTFFSMLYMVEYDYD